MKLSIKIILPIILISALLILLNGCFGVPTDESPGYTPGTITGIIASPCCPATSAESVSETCCLAPEFWCYYCQENWSLQEGIEVVLTYGEDEIATTTTNDKGEFTFTDVAPGKNYVITAYCPDFDDNRPLVKDVALEVASSFDTGITDLVSTSLGLVVDFLVLYTDWGPEDISLDEVLADRPLFPNFPKFKKLVIEVRRVLENCEVNLLTDDEVQDALCRAAEEISGLEIGCGPGYTPPYLPPTPDPCYGNLAPDLTVPASVTIDAGTTYVGTASATDDGIKFGTDLVFSASIAPTPTTYGLTIDPDTGVINWVSDCDDIVADDLTDYVVTVTVDDGCEPVSKSFTITLDPEVCDPCYGNAAPEVIVPDDSLGIFVDAGSTYEADIFMSDVDLIKDPLTYTISISPPVTNSLVITPITGGVHISWDTDCADIVDGVNTDYTITVEAFDGCDPTIKSFTITLLAEPCVPCSLSLQVKEGGKLVEYLDGLPFTTTVPPVPGNITYITYDDITVGTNASKLWFRICASPEAEMVYNFYRGGSCPDEWDYDDLGGGTPPGWSPVLDSKFNTQYYPDGYPKPSPDDLIICNTGDPIEPVNILMVKVTEGNLITIYTFNIFR